MRTIKMILFAIFVLLLTDKVTDLALDIGLSNKPYIIPKAVGTVASAAIALWALIQDE